MNAKMIVLLALFHGVAIGFVVVMVVMLRQSSPLPGVDDSHRPGGDGGQRPGRPLKPGPCSGGLPFDGARRARVRLRGFVHGGTPLECPMRPRTKRARRIRCVADRRGGRGTCGAAIVPRA
jgi:hypothetical protein